MVCVRTNAGDVYTLEEDRILVYGKAGIAVQLNQRLMRTLSVIARTLKATKLRDIKDKRFEAQFCPTADAFTIDVDRGEQVVVARSKLFAA